MYLPAFDDRGLLPPNENDAPYRCSPADVEQRLVTDLGAPTWRVQLYEGWDLLRRGVALVAPSARWWLWGCFVSAHSEPQFGDAETIEAAVFLPVRELPPPGSPELEMLVDFVHSAQARHRVNVAKLYEVSPEEPGYLDYVDAVEFKWRPRASTGVPDHESRELEPAGFIEVLGR
jgi:hypothetical protein